MSFFFVIFFLFKKKLSPGISRDGDQFCSVIPGYGKTSEILGPSLHMLSWDTYVFILENSYVSNIKLSTSAERVFHFAIRGRECLKFTDNTLFFFKYYFLCHFDFFNYDVECLSLMPVKSR